MGRLTFMSLVALLLLSCSGSIGPSPSGPGSAIPLKTLPRTSSPQTGTPAPVATGRSICGPDSLASVGGGLTGGQADAMEALQSQYEDVPGFMAAVSDASAAYVVVDGASLADWKARLAGTGVRVVRSCVDARLVKAAQDTLAQITKAPGDFSAGGYDALQDAVVISTNLDANLVRGRIAAAAPGVPFDDSTLRITYADYGCRGVGLDATIRGDPADPRIVWLVTDRGREIDVVWPPGWAARFTPSLEVLDPAGNVRYHEGDAVTGGCVVGPANDPGSLIELDL